MTKEWWSIEREEKGRRRDRQEDRNEEIDKTEEGRKKGHTTYTKNYLTVVTATGVSFL